MQHTVFFAFLLIFSLLLSACRSETAGSAHPEVGNLIAQIKSENAPDRRTDRLEISWISGRAGAPDTLRGLTTLPEGISKLESAWDSAGLDQTVLAIRTLPDAVVGKNRFGIVAVSVANLRSTPGHSQELATQALLGTPLQLLDFADGWYLVRTPDRYLAWLEEGALVAGPARMLEAWFDEKLHYCKVPNTLVYASPAKEKILTDLVYGNLLRVGGASVGDWTSVILPDGSSGWVLKSTLSAFKAWAAPDGLEAGQLLEAANTLAGRPYLWGGTSSKGMDCSGFTKMAYFLNGLVIPRDASQQVQAGTPVPLDDEFSALRAGDLLFFGNFRTDGSERITHVGCYLGEGRFIHSGADNGRITVNSLLPDDEVFAPHRLSSLMRVQRLMPGTKGVATVSESFSKLWKY